MNRFFRAIEPRGLWAPLFRKLRFHPIGSEKLRRQGRACHLQGVSPLIVESVLSSRKGHRRRRERQAPNHENRIISNAFGVVLLTDTSSPEISQNLIYRNKYGNLLQGFGDPIIRNNYIYDNLNFDVVNISVKSL